MREKRSLPQPRRNPPTSPCPPPSFRRRPESRTPVCPRMADKGGEWIPAFAGMTVGDGNDSGTGWRCRAFLPHPTLSRWERALRLAAWFNYELRIINCELRLTAQRNRSISQPPLPTQYHSRPTVIPAKAGIHIPGLSAVRDIPGFWIPAGAGMTVGAAVGLAGFVGVGMRRVGVIPPTPLLRKGGFFCRLCRGGG